jgi:dCTP deaminase
MLLSKPDIIARVKAGLKKPTDYRSLSFSPEIPVAKITDQCSIDLHLAPVFTVFKQKNYVATYDIQNAKDIFEAEDLWEHHQVDRWKLEPRQFVLSRTLETVHLPHDLMGLVEGRSSFARFGIGIHVTAPKIDPGYKDPITLELTNHSTAAWELHAGPNGIAICQLMLTSLKTPLKLADLYGASAKDLFAGHDMPVPAKKKK